MDYHQQLFMDLCHILFCKMPHAQEMQDLAERKEGTCYYNLEKSLGDAEKQPDHVRISILSEALLMELELLDAKEAIELFQQVLDLCQQLNQITSERPKLLNYIKDWIT